jgi:AcrR family transcriptional regulator
MPSESLRASFRRHMRDQVLSATHALTIEKGWAQVRISDIAALVGVSRPTIYKEFGDKQGLGDAMIVREAERFLSVIKAVLEDHAGDAGTAITSAIHYTLDEAEQSPLLRAALTSTPNEHHATTNTGVLPLLTTSAPMLETASVTVVAWFGEHFPELDPPDVADAVDALIRLTVSYLVLPTEDPGRIEQRICKIALRYLGLSER